MTSLWGVDQWEDKYETEGITKGGKAKAIQRSSSDDSFQFYS